MKLQGKMGKLLDQLLEHGSMTENFSLRDEVINDIKEDRPGIDYVVV